MALIPERYAEIDAELQQVCEYLAALADELGTGAAYAPAVYALGAITRLRHSLEQTQEHDRIGDEIQRRLYGGKQ